ncbi:MAG: twin-arginine translocase TatA/TatE family subunit [Agromyces sp.]
MFGLTFEKLLLIGVVAAFVIGPERLPTAAAQLGALVRRLRGFTEGAKDRMRDEMGPEFDEVDWKKLDPRQYDPRRIIRDALTDELTPTSGVHRPAPPRFQPLAEGTAAPFDVEAT